MTNLGGNTHIKFSLGGNWRLKVVKMSVGDHKPLNYVVKKGKAAHNYSPSRAFLPRYCLQMLMAYTPRNY